ncbi:MAG: hypothetical protein J7L15_02815 [Clostridiales bacterium]|nr:hypothetical protein [Clostridiales bacterium]
MKKYLGLRMRVRDITKLGVYRVTIYNDNTKSRKDYELISKVIKISHNAVNFEDYEQAEDDKPIWEYNVSDIDDDFIYAYDAEFIGDRSTHPGNFL